MAVAPWFDFLLCNLKQDAKCTCVGCPREIGKQYIRDLQTGLLYHNVMCYEAHVSTSQKAIDHVEVPAIVKEDFYR